MCSIVERYVIDDYVGIAVQYRGSLHTYNWRETTGTVSYEVWQRTFGSSNRWVILTPTQAKLGVETAQEALEFIESHLAMKGLELPPG